MSELDKIDLLMGLGLSPNQAKVYQTILKLGNATFIQIAKSSSVRREDVYKVLPALEKMGLAEKLLGKPAMIRATPVAGALASLILDEKVKSDERIASMKTKFRTLSKAKWAQPLVVGEEESLYALIPEGKAVIAKLTSLVANLKSDIFWIATLKEILHVASLISSEITKAIHKELKIRALIEDATLDESQIRKVQHALKLESGNARFQPQSLNRFIVFDGREAMISTNKESETGETAALWTTDSNLIGVLRGYFETSWNAAQEHKQTTSN